MDMEFDYKTREDRVQEFLDVTGKPNFHVAWGCLGEEFMELKEAAQDFHVILESNADDEKKAEYRARFVKEWADVQYTLSQLAIFYNIPGEEAFIRVSDNNMTKVQDGKVLYREDGKVLKPEGYQKPDMLGL